MVDPGQHVTDEIMTAVDTALAIASKPTIPDKWRMLLQGRDHLRQALASHDHDACRFVDAWGEGPSATGDEGFDALLAALTRHEFETAGREAPVWSRIEPLPEPLIFEHPFMSENRVIATTPEFLRLLNIFVPARDLVTA